jgi:hypothetical protein
MLYSFDKNQYSEQLLLLQIVNKYVIDGIIEDPKTPINKEVERVIEKCLKSEGSLGLT